MCDSEIEGLGIPAPRAETSPDSCSVTALPREGISASQRDARGRTAWPRNGSPGVKAGEMGLGIIHDDLQEVPFGLEERLLLDESLFGPLELGDGPKDVMKKNAPGHVIVRTVTRTSLISPFLRTMPGLEIIPPHTQDGLNMDARFHGLLSRFDIRKPQSPPKSVSAVRSSPG